jgi:hypothetical protein
MYRSISHQLYKTQEQYARIRNEICSFIIQQREDFEPFIEDDVPFDTVCNFFLLYFVFFFCKIIRSTDDHPNLNVKLNNYFST